MENSSFFNSSSIVGMQIEEIFKMYSMSCRVGSFCNFDINQKSNQLHNHNCYELCIVTSGSGAFIYNGDAFRLNCGDAFIADPYVAHEIQTVNQETLQLIYFFIEFKANSLSSSMNAEDQLISEFLRKHRIIIHSQKQLLVYFSFIEAYTSIKKGRSFGVYHAIRNLILECLDALSFKGSILTDSVNFSGNTLELSLDYIDNNLNRKITIEEISRHSKTSVRNLQYIFKKHINKTITEYISERKIELASHYLARQFSVQDTADLIGINDSSQFTRLFKKYKLISPKKYQQLHAPKEKGFGRRL